ncbi:Uncharacterized protein HZ326_11036 [Fusarium oxysporum f. sp. albedinis]|nr:Uncharacterized protein HZ326_11036 [Fusarium oxysporum f. sp. albedinis]
MQVLSLFWVPGLGIKLSSFCFLLPISSFLSYSLPLNPNLVILASTTRYLKLFNSSQQLPFILNCLTCFGYPGPTSFRPCAR